MRYNTHYEDRKKTIGHHINLGIFVLLCIVNLTPFVWGLITSLKTEREVLQYPPKFLFFTPSLEHYITIFENNFFHSVLVTLGYSACAIVIGVTFGLMAAYAMKRYNFFGKKALFFAILCGIPLSIGSAAMVIPNYVYFSTVLEGKPNEFKQDPNYSYTSNFQKPGYYVLIVTSSYDGYKTWLSNNTAGQITKTTTQIYIFQIFNCLGSTYGIAVVCSSIYSQRK